MQLKTTGAERSQRCGYASILLSILQVALVVLVPWTSRSYPGITLLPIGVSDYAILYGAIKLAEKVMGRGDAASSQA